MLYEWDMLLILHPISLDSVLHDHIIKESYSVLLSLIMGYGLTSSSQIAVGLTEHGAIDIEIWI